MVGYGTFAAYNTFFGLYLRGLGVNTGALYERLHGRGMFLAAAVICIVSILGLLLIMPRDPTLMKSGQARLEQFRIRAALDKPFRKQV